MAGYGQFCPVAKAMEVLDERWTMLVLRELMMGSRHFNELRRGLPRMSPALLSKRLRSLERSGLVSRSDEAGRTAYDLTQSGWELFDVVEGLAIWGQKWISELGEEDLDPHLLMWDMKRSIPATTWPEGRTTLAVRFRDVERKAGQWWIVVKDGQADVCDFDPGFDVDVEVDTTLRCLTRLWRGDLSWSQAMAAEELTLRGPTDVRRQVPAWLGEDNVAPLGGRRPPGRTAGAVG